MELVLPSERYAASFLAAEQEMLAAGDRTADEVITAATLPSKLARWEAMRHKKLDDTRVPSTSWWLVDGDEFIGRISVRHSLDDRLRNFGGHIGYDVRPSRRREGHGTRMLRMVLPFAKSLGIDPAMLTCDKNNVASRRMIESCGGHVADEYEFEGTTRLRLWLPTA